jgi:hypothetical protein
MSMEDFVKTLNEEQKKALLEALNEKSITEKAKPTNEETNKAVNNSFIAESKASINNQKRREPVRAKKNQWEDTGECRDVVTPDYEKTPRKRQPHKKIDIECSSCGKSFKVDPRFVYGEYYRCNRCVGKR